MKKIFVLIAIFALLIISVSSCVQIKEIKENDFSYHSGSTSESDENTKTSETNEDNGLTTTDTLSTTDSSTTDSSLNSGSGTTTENSTDSSCGLTDVSSGDTTNDSQGNTDNSTGNETADSITEPPMDEVSPYYFYTYKELISNFHKECKESSVIQQEKSRFGEKFKTFVDTITENSLLKLPSINSELLTLRNREGYHNMSVFQRETYGLPWIWYHGEIEGKMVRVMMTYPTHVEIEEGMDASQIIELLYPGAANVHNYQDSGIYEYFYLCELELQDKTVSAIACKEKDRPWINVRFYYDGYWISINTEFSLEDTEFWKSFGLIDAASLGDSFVDKKLVSLMPQWLTEEERELLYNKELYESKVDIENRAIIKVYEGVTPWCDDGRVLSLEELLELAEATAQVKYLVLNDYNVNVKIVKNGDETSIAVVKPEHTYSVHAVDLKAQGTRLEVNGEEYNINAVYCFDDLTEGEDFFVYYVTDGGVFFMLYIEDNSMGILMGESEFLD